MGMFFRRLTVLRGVLVASSVIALAPLFAACGGASEAQTLGEELEGRTWRSQDVLVEGGFDRELFPLAAGTRIVATFENEQDRLVTDLLLEGPTVTVEADFMTWTGRSLIIEFIDEEWVDPEPG